MNLRPSWLALYIVAAVHPPFECNGTVGGGEPSPPRLRCQVRGDDRWQSYVISSNVERPCCPVNVPWRNYRVDFWAGFSAYNSNVVPSEWAYNTVVAHILDHNYQPHDSASAQWIHSDYGIAEANMRGSYRVGYNFGNTDHALLWTWIFPVNSFAYGGVDMPVNITKTGVIGGPSQAAPGNWVTVSMTVNPSDFEAPPTYTWRLDGSPVGSNSSEITVQLPDPGVHKFVATVWDTLGNVAEDSLSVDVQWPECPDCMAPSLDTSAGIAPGTGTGPRRNRPSHRPPLKR